MTIDEARKLKSEVDAEISASLQKLSDAGLEPGSVDLTFSTSFGHQPKVMATVAVRIRGIT